MFKKTLIGISLAISLNTSAQHIAISLMPYFGGMVKLTDEVTLGRRFSAVMQFENGIVKPNDLQPPHKHEVKGWGITPELRWYPNNKHRRAPAGPYLGVYYNYRSLTEEYSWYDARYPFHIILVPASGIFRGTKQSLGFSFGLKILKRMFFTEVGLGVAYAWTHWKESEARKMVNESDRNEIDKPLVFRFNLSFGFAFPKYSMANLENHDQSLGQAIPFTSQNQDSELATLIIYQKKKFFGSFASIRLSINDVSMGKISQGMQISRELPEGRVNIRSRKHQISAVLEKGKTYYLEITNSYPVMRFTGPPQENN